MRLLEIKKPRVLGPAALVFKGCLKTPSSSPPRYDNYNDAAQYNDLVFHLAVFHVLQVEKCLHPTKIIDPCQDFFVHCVKIIF